MSTALYRRYRPETFADVIGQEHVTEPLMQALRSGRINHAYLFSGPRGCGKTTSARILARCLNCEQGPTDTPCGECESCVALARGGSGSVDVIEIDAASHGGVDDARDLREKAAYGPARSRYKVYIIDEAHMVTPQGFNALLKIVEEPPEHVKFVFATTEPDKVIGTIRSRTHHYPFRLVPPARLLDYLEHLCESEGVQVAPGVLSFVIRAGGGSVRDSLSVLDQLMAGAGEDGLTYERAAALLGFTEVELLDATVDALAAGDGAAAFRQVDKVIESGHDPRRFLEDLLERMRDLIVVLATEEGAAAVLRGVPEDQLERMRGQAAAFGAGALSRAADVVNTGLTEMTGATSPRLQLELVVARLLLPGAAGEHGYAARLDRLERRMEMGGMPSHGAPVPGGAPAPGGALPVAPAFGGGAPGPDGPDAHDQGGPGGLTGAAAARAAVRRGGAGEGRPDPARQVSEPGRQGAEPGRQSAEPGRQGPDPRAGQPDREHEAAAREAARPTDGALDPDASGTPTEGGVSPVEREALQQDAVDRQSSDGPVDGPGSAAPAERPAPAGSPEASAQAAPRRGPGGVDADMIRRAWPDVLARVFREKRVTWTMLSEHAQVMDYDGRVVRLGINNPGVQRNFASSKVHPEVLRQALIDVLGVDAQVEGVPLASHAAGGAGHQAPQAGGRAPQAGDQAPQASGQAPRHGGPGPEQAGPRPAQHAPAHPQAGPSRPSEGEVSRPVGEGQPHEAQAPRADQVPGRAAESSPSQGAGQPGRAPESGPSPSMREALGVVDGPSRQGGPGWSPQGPAPEWATPSPDAAPSTDDAPATGPAPSAEAGPGRAPGGPERPGPASTTPADGDPDAQPRDAGPQHPGRGARPDSPQGVPAAPGGEDVPWPGDEDEPVDDEAMPPEEEQLSPFQRAMRRAAGENDRTPQRHQVSDDDVSQDDESVDDGGGSAGPAVIANVLGGTIISDTLG